jgi:cytochrome c oxidase cbb3-type subunit 2
MPSYAHLFDDGRGDDLVRYLKESGVGATADVMARAAAWKPGVAAGGDGRSWFEAHCAVCHGDGGRGDGPLAGKFIRPPANLVDGPFIWTAAGEDLATRTARVIKFGIPGTDMPGHEVMTEAQVNALADTVLGLRSNQPRIRSWKADEGRKWVRLRLTRWVEQGRRAATGAVCPCSSSTAAQFGSTTPQASGKLA